MPRIESPKCKECGTKFGNMIRLGPKDWICSECKGYPRVQAPVFR